MGFGETVTKSRIVTKSRFDSTNQMDYFTIPYRSAWHSDDTFAESSFCFNAFSGNSSSTFQNFSSSFSYSLLLKSTGTDCSSVETSIAQVKDTNRKIRKTMIIYICGSLIGSKLGSSCPNTGERTWETQQRLCEHLAWYMEPKFNHSIL